MDFSANCNPLGTPESVKQAVRDSLDRTGDYPQVGYAPLREALGEYEDMDPRHIICGNGAAELIFSLCQAVRPKKALIPVPTFAEYEQALTSVGCQVEHVLLREEDGFCMQESFIEWLHGDLDMVFLCNPNNPTGILTDREFLFHVLRRCRELGILLVVYECFLDFVKEPGKYSLKAQLSRYHNLLDVYKRQGRFCKMAGVIPGKVFRTPGLSRFGYIMLSQQKTVLGEKDLGRIPAHEFHYFDSETCGKDFRAEKPESTRGWAVSYTHLDVYKRQDLRCSKGCRR